MTNETISNSNSNGTSNANGTNSNRNRNRNHNQNRHGNNDAAWHGLTTLQESKHVVNAIILGASQRKDGVVVGLTVQVNGIRGFIPNSLLDRGVRAASATGQLPVIIDEVKQSERRLLCNHKAAAEKQRTEAINALTLDSWHDAEVAHVFEYGCIVKIGVARGLLHNNQTTDNSASKRSVGETVHVRVCEVGNGKVSFSQRTEAPAQPKDRVETFHQRQQATAAQRTIKTLLNQTPAAAAAPKSTKKAPAKRRDNGQVFSSFADLATAWGVGETDAASTTEPQA